MTLKNKSNLDRWVELCSLNGITSEDLNNGNAVIGTITEEFVWDQNRYDEEAKDGNVLHPRFIIYIAADKKYKWDLAENEWLELYKILDEIEMNK